jgi:hypothetical protein
LIRVCNGLPETLNCTLALLVSVRCSVSSYPSDCRAYPAVQSDEFTEDEYEIMGELRGVSQSRGK